MVKKKLAVVVPMYNVELFLKEALDSLLDQGLPSEEYQIILIDDGSTDNTLKIAREYVEKFPKIFELFTFENAGLGAARNRGTRLASAKYIAYLDPDDKLTAGIYKKAVDLLDETNSEILIGGTKRFNSKKVWNSTIHSRSVNTDLVKTNINEHPELVWDTTSWNKIYKLDYIRENDFYFPEGMLYEDLPAVTPAIAKAESVDVISDTMYLWRVRDFGTPSITQMSENSTEPIIDRLNANLSVMRSLNKMKASDEVINRQAWKFLNFDTMMMFRRDKFDLFSDSQKALLFKTLVNYLNIFTEEQLQTSRYENLAYYKAVLAAEGQEAFNELTINFLRNETKYSGFWADGQYYLSSDITSFVKKATKDDFVDSIKIENVKFTDDKINISGYILFKYSDMSKSELVKSANLNVKNEFGEVIASGIGNVVITKRPEITSKFGYNQVHTNLDVSDFNYDYSGFEISAELSSIKIDKFVTFEVVINVDGIDLTVDVKNPINGSDVRPNDYTVGETKYIVDYNSDDWRLMLSNAKSGGTLSFDPQSGYSIQTSFNEINLISGNKYIKVMDDDGKVLLPAEFTRFGKETRKNWNLVAIDGSEEYTISYSGNRELIENKQSVAFFGDKKNGTTLTVTRPLPIIDDIQVRNDTLELKVRLMGWQAEAKFAEIIADWSLRDIRWNGQHIGTGIFSFRIPLKLTGFGRKEWLNFKINMKFANGTMVEENLRWGPKKFDLKNEFVSSDGVQWKLHEVEKFEMGGFALRRNADRVFRLDTGGFERFIEKSYQEWLKEPLLENTVVWSAYWGRDNKFGGNPRALYDYVQSHYPNLQHVIVIKDKIDAYPEYKNAQVISFGTKEYWYYLARAKYFVNDVNFTERNRFKRNDQIEIQTMHGTPLKTLGFDVLSEWSDSTYNNYLRRFRSYDYLVVPSDWVAKYAQKAFNINPEILSTGYPRNDIFFQDHPEKELLSLKKMMGISAEKKVVLYAPTWRIQDRGFDTSLDEFVNVDALYKSLDEDTVIIVKPHNFQPIANVDKKYRDKIFFATSDITIEELYLISDALVTDYSSVMFDYSLLGKPMIFWAFDFDDYLENRGMNLDLEGEAPGPFVTNQRSLENWIKKSDVIGEKFDQRISAFRLKFNEYDNGHASEQIAEKVWGNPAQ